MIPVEEIRNNQISLMMNQLDPPLHSISTIWRQVFQKGLQKNRTCRNRLLRLHRCPGGSSELSMESIPPVHWTKSTPRDFTISQKIDENSAGYQQLLHMLEDLGHRRKDDIIEKQQTEFYVSRASSLMDSIDNVHTAYSEIKSLTSQPSFYYIPKRQRYLMVNKIVTDMSATGQTEMMSLNKKAKAFCRTANVDTPPYSLGNLFGNMLANGAVLSK
ncbi:hypothetical protein CRE_02583 [Caenorhabditis remanei]|uniref:Uncharacterized protein n=1 Tax=Caenorhabditis remanei TaxID=31234 RepID=E3N4V1_CAERE|nr:hypothetical protein CRE_02583 [Caenorhabditis remanei]